MFIKHISINNFVGITELSKDLGKVNHLTGRKGSGKSSFVESLQKGFTNTSERTEIVRHGETEATIFIQTDTGLEIDRKIRTGGKADYFKIRKPGEAVPSSEKFLKQFINGDIFKPLEFVSKSPTEQAKIILNLLEIPWTMDDISNWFGEIPDSVNYSAHILQVLAQIVTYYFDRRAAINQEIVVLKAQVKGYRDELPPNYDGEEWRLKKVSEYYGKVAEAEEVNKRIDSSKNIIEGLESRIATIRAEAETDKQSKRNQMDQKRNEIKEYKQFVENKITEARSVIAQSDAKIKQSENELDLELERKLQQLKDEYAIKKQVAKSLVDDEINMAEQRIANYGQSIATKDQEFCSIDELEAQSLLSISEKADERIKTEDAKVGSARQILSETNPI